MTSRGTVIDGSGGFVTRVRVTSDADLPGSLIGQSSGTTLKGPRVQITTWIGDSLANAVSVPLATLLAVIQPPRKRRRAKRANRSAK